MEYRSCGKGLAEMLVLFYFPKFVYSTVLTLTESKNVTSRNVPLKILQICPWNFIQLCYLLFIRNPNKETKMLELVLETLRKNVERTTETSYGTFGMVYLDNVSGELSKVMSKHQFAGYCAVLRKEGKYKQVDGFFGEVILETPLTE